METKLSNIETKIAKLDETSTLSKRLKLSAKVKGLIESTEKDFERNLEKLTRVHEINNISEDSEDSIDIDDEQIKEITNRIECTKIQIDKETDIETRITMYSNLKIDIEQCKAYYSQVKMTVKNLN